MKTLIISVAILFAAACKPIPEIEVIQHESFKLIAVYESGNYKTASLCNRTDGRAPSCSKLSREQYTDLKDKFIRVKQKRQIDETQKMIDKANAEFNQ